MASSCLRWGLLSAGRISHDFGAALRMLPKEEHVIGAVAARSLEKAQEFAKKLDIPQAYGSYEELAKDANIDVVYIGTVHPHHHACSRMMLEHGKHVLCEKPIAMNSWQLNDLVTLARTKQCFLMEGFWSRFFPAYDQIQREISEKNIGDIKLLQVDFGFEMSEYYRIAEKAMGGGAILDVGCYVVQFANLVFGGEKPQQIIAAGNKLPTGVDDTVAMTLLYSGNRMAQLNCSCTLTLDQTANLYGTKGTIKVPNFWNPTEVITPTKTHTFPLPETSFKFNFVRSQGFTYQAQAVRDAILRGDKEASKMPLQSSVEIMEILDEVRRQMNIEYDADRCNVD